MPRPARIPWCRLAAALVLPLSAGCSHGEPARPRNVLLVTLDTTRADALGCLGGRPGVTPNLDALAAEGVLFERARTVAPMTLPAHASILTGLWPPLHTVRDNSLTRLPASATTLAELALPRGIDTAAIVSARVLRSGLGLEQGFRTYDEPAPPDVAAEGAHFGRRGAEEVTSAAVSWLEARDPRRRFFLWVHYFDPHRPYRASPEDLARAGGDPYLGCVARMDAAIGELFEALRASGDWEDTLVVVVADHGEGLGEHGEDSHSAFVFDTTIRVPLILRHPDGHRAGERSRETVSVADLFPTIVDALELGSAGDVDGVSLFGRRVEEDRGVYFESFYGALYYGWSPLSGWADGAGKYVHSSEPELYLPGSDPREERNLFATRADVTGPYLDAIVAVMARQPLAREGAAADPSFLAELRALGYAGAGAAGEVIDPLAVEGLPSPHARAEELSLVFRSWNLSTRQRWDESIALLRRILEINPENHEARSRLGGYLTFTGRHAEAVEELLRFAESGPAWPDPYADLALSLHGLGRVEEALTWLERAIDLDHRNKKALTQMVAILREQGRADEAQPYLRLLAELSR